MANDRITFTKRQLQELKWFCENCTGLHAEFYKVFDEMASLKAKLQRLEKTCDLIKPHLESEDIDPMETK